MISRRVFLLGAPGVALTLAGCGVFSSKTVNGVTTYTVDIAKLEAYATAVQNGADALLAVPVIYAALGPAGAAVSGALSALGAALAGLKKQAGGATALSFSVTSVPAALGAFQQNAEKVLSIVQGAVTGLGTRVPAFVAPVLNALETVVALIIAQMPTVGSTFGHGPAPQVKMPAQKALRILNAG